MSTLLVATVLFVNPRVVADRGHQVTVSEKTIAHDARNRQAHEAWVQWEKDGDAAAAIGTLRRLLGEETKGSSSYLFNIARIVQSEGRKVEAAEWYWKACHLPFGEGQTRNGLGFFGMTRVVDALEDVGRTDDARWGIAEVGVSSRREFYAKVLEENGGHPLWVQKWARKMLDDDPNDAVAKTAFAQAVKSLEIMRAHPEHYGSTRDLPFVAPK